MDDLGIPAKPGDAMVNVLACFPDLEWLQRDFDIMYFLDLCAGLDALVIHNTLFTTGPLQSFTSSTYNPVVKALCDTDVLQVYRLSSSNPLKAAEKILNQERSQQIRSIVPNFYDGDPELFGALIAHISSLSEDVGLEDFLQIPFVCWAHALPLYVSIPEVQNEQKAMRRLQGALAKKYSDFKETLFALRQAADGEDIIRIPPIALQSLTKAKSLDQLGEVALEIRNKYRKVRERFAELDEI